MASTARFDELKKKFDENPRRYFAPLANEFRKSGDAEQAVMICEEFLPQQPGHMSGHIVYGQALFDLGRLDDARTVFETALTLDPENLIALRHLGDIARQHGDSASARHWYERVLESDPRNEEVQTLIGDLDSDGTSAAPAFADPHATLPSAEHGGMVDVAPAFEAPPTLPASPPAPDQLLELDVVEEHALGAGPTSSAASERPQQPAVLEGLESTAAGEPPRDSSGTVGFEPMEFTPPSTPPAPGGIADELESGEFAAPSAPIAPLAGLEESAVGAFEARPSAAAPPPLPDLEPTTDFATTVSSASDDTEALPVDIPPEVIAAEAELIDARERVEPVPPASESPASVEPSRDDASRGSDIQPPTPPRVTPSQPFVTETMAELYIKQGFREQALDVYKLLLAASPDNARLRERVAELQAPVPDSGPNVREFFARLAARRSVDRRAAAEPPASSDFALLDSFETVPSATQSPAPAASTPTENESEVGHQSPQGEGSIDALFGGQRPVDQSDASAASALAQAFAGDAESPPISGRPARAAAGELSLDSVFRDSGARPPRSAQSFSFDQFFSESAASEPLPPSPASATPSQGTGAQGEPAQRSDDDIEQFNSWLQGLKPR